MELSDFTARLGRAGKRFHLIGDAGRGVVAALDMEGRLFAVLEGEVLSRVNAQVIARESTAGEYCNPGGDVLWPAPEGTCLGYQYSTGSWRVPPGITGARYIVAEEGESRTVIRAEIDLVNAAGLGLPTVFQRAVSVSGRERSLRVSVSESITYVGTRALSRSQCLLAPWTLCQIDSGPGAEVVFPETGDIWDMYDTSLRSRFRRDGLWHALADAEARYQVGIGPQTHWLEFRDSTRGLFVRRAAAPVPTGQEYIDIADADPGSAPAERCTRLSLYNEPSGFMEIEAAGGCPQTITPGCVMSLEVETEYCLRDGQA